MGRPVAWFDITAKDAAKSREFYAKLFDWDINVVEEMNYGMVSTGGSEGIAGGIGQADENNTPGIIIYTVVDDAKAALEKAEALGGKTDVPPYEIPGTGILAVFKDPDGNRFGLWQR